MASTLTTRHFQRCSAFGRSSTIIAFPRSWCSLQARRRRIVGGRRRGADGAAARWLSSYIRDVLRTRSLTPGNPLIKALATSTTTLEEYLSCLPLIEADHVPEAIAHVRDQQAAVRSSRYYHPNVFAAAVPRIANPATTTSTSSTTENDDEETARSIPELIRAMNDLETPARNLRQMCAMMVHLGQVNASTVGEWQMAAAAVSQEFRPFQDLAKVPMGRWKNMESWLQNHHHRSQKATLADTRSKNADDAPTRFAADFLIQEYKILTGVMDLADGDAIDGKNATRYREYGTMLEDIELNLLAAQSFGASPTLLSNVYNYIGLRTEQARLLGHDNAVDQILSRSTVTTLSEIHAMHQVVETVIAPEIRRLTGAKTSDEIELESYLMPTSSSSSAESRTTAFSAKQMECKKDEFDMMKLEHYVTLDGALQFLFQLLNSLAGITFEPVANVNGSSWSETRTYRAMDEGTCIGTLLIDPLARPGSLHGAVSIPVIDRSATQAPFVCLSLSVKPPAWRGDAIRVNWEDCESLFHEMGHCVQLLMGRSELGSILGPANLPADVSEFLPKFMEHWLAEESAVMAMINLSQCNRSFTEESLIAAQRVRSRTKMFKLAEQAFQSKFEISFLSEFDLKGSETVMDRQASIARAFVPHTSLDKNNLEPLIDVLKRNAAGHQVAAYRYLWADFASASVFAALRQSHQTNPESAVKRFRADVRRSGLLPGAAADFGTLLGLYAGQTLETNDLLKLYKIE